MWKGEEGERNTTVSISGADEKRRLEHKLIMCVQCYKNEYEQTSNGYSCFHFLKITKETTNLLFYCLWNLLWCNIKPGKINTYRPGAKKKMYIMVLKCSGFDTCSIDSICDFLLISTENNIFLRHLSLYKKMHNSCLQKSTYDVWATRTDWSHKNLLAFVRNVHMYTFVHFDICWNVQCGLLKASKM